MCFTPDDSYHAACARLEVMPFNSGLSAAESADRAHKLWKNADRDEAVVQVCTAFCDRRWDELRAIGIMEQPAVIPDYLLDNCWTDVLVSNRHHAQRLSKSLPNFELRCDRLARSIFPRPLATITTLKAGWADLSYWPTVVVNAHGALTRVFGVTVPTNRVFVELFDEANEVTRHDGLARLANYAKRGFILPEVWEDRLSQWLEASRARVPQLDEESKRVSDRLTAAIANARAKPSPP